MLLKREIPLKGEQKAFIYQWCFQAFDEIFVSTLNRRKNTPKILLPKIDLDLWAYNKKNKKHSLDPSI